MSSNPGKRRLESDSETENEVASDLEFEIDKVDLSQKGYETDEEGGYKIDDIYIRPPPKTIDQLNGIRLIVSKIINTNFKSYGTEKILGPFHKNFNAIIGSNGSGKSNIIDALLFVFGSRATRLRTKKLSDLIHRTSKSLNNSSCSVAVHFEQIKTKPDDDEYYEIVENSAFVVSRVAFSDNTSYYMINDNKVQYREVANLLRKHGIDLDHNRFLILQGEIEQISLMKPKATSEHETGMLEYLEDIIGTSRYKEPLELIDSKIDILNQKCLEKLTRVKITEREKNSLEKPMMEAVKFLESENKISREKNFLFQREILDIKGIYKELNNELTKYVEENKSIDMEIEKLMNEKNVIQSKYSDRNSKREKLQEKKDEVTTEFDKLNNKDTSLQSEFEKLVKNRKQMIENLKTEAEKVKKFEEIPEKNLATIQEYEEREKKLVAEIELLQNKKQKIFVKISEETSDLQKKKETLQNELLPLINEMNEKQSAFRLVDIQLNLLKTNENREGSKLEKLKENYNEKKDKLPIITEKINKLKENLSELTKQQQQISQNLKRAAAEEASTLNSIKTQRILVEESRSSMQANRSQNKVTIALEKQKAEGKIPGLYGRLGDLGAIDPKYDIAVSTAAGALDNFVVDTFETAEWCVNYLKTYDVGRATFIVLEKQEHLRAAANSKIKTPENVPRLYDLIKIENDAIRPAFYYAVRDTLVAVNIDQATRIAYGEKRYRVVTLKGEIIEISGTMTGGGRTVCKSKMGSSIQNKFVSREKLDEMDNALQTLENKLVSLRQSQNDFEKKSASLLSEIHVTQGSIQKFTAEYDSIKEILPSLQKQIREQEQVYKKSCVNPAEIENKKITLKSKEQEYNKIEQVVKKLQDKVDVITKEFNDKVEKETMPFIKKIDENTRVLSKLKDALVKLRVEMTTSERNAKRSKTKIVNLEKDKVEAENRLKAIRTERENIETEATQLKKTLKTVLAELKIIDDDSKDEYSALELINKDLLKIKTNKVECEFEIDRISKKVKEIKMKTEDIQTKLSKLEIHEIPEKELEQLRKYTEDELLEKSSEEIKEKKENLKRHEQLIRQNQPNLNAIKEYKQKEENYIHHVSHFEKYTDKRKQMKNIRTIMRKKRVDEFHLGFRSIATKLKQMYQLITFGGDAELEFSDSYDPYSEGVVFNVRPPKKTWKQITNLSGGEKTLSSVALIFALHHYKPSPLYFMDEIDAALDFKNVSIVGNYIKERTKNSQFIIISLRANMFELADHLIGIYKQNDSTLSIAIRPDDFEYDKGKNNKKDMKEVQVTQITEIADEPPAPKRRILE